MDYTINNLPLFGGVLIVLLVLLTSGGEFFSFLGVGGAGLPNLPKEGYRYYIGSSTVLYILPQKTKCKVYILEGPPRRISGASKADDNAHCASNGFLSAG